MLKLLGKVGVYVLALMLAALPVAACVLPGAAMTKAERDCCKKMAERCGGAGMAKSHSCCQTAAAPSDLHALKVSVTRFGDAGLNVLHRLPASTQYISRLRVAPVAFQISDVHGPPGLDALTTPVLRI